MVAITFTFIQYLPVFGEDWHLRSQHPSGWTTLNAPIALILTKYVVSTYLYRLAGGPTDARNPFSPLLNGESMEIESNAVPGCCGGTGNLGYSCRVLGSVYGIGLLHSICSS
jgi:hypothetical protein